MTRQALGTVVARDLAALSTEVCNALIVAWFAAAIGAAVVLWTCRCQGGFRAWLAAARRGTLLGVVAWLVVLFGAQFFVGRGGSWNASWYDGGALGPARFFAALVFAIGSASCSLLRPAWSAPSNGAERPPAVTRRFTLRQLLLAQALLAVVFGGWLVHARPSVLDERARLEHRERERIARQKFSHYGWQVSEQEGLISLRWHTPRRQDHVTDETLAEVARFGHIRLLTFDSHHVTDRGLQELTALPELWLVHLNAERVTNDGIATMARLPKLSDLEIRGPQITEAVLEPLASAPGLEKLNLSRIPVTDAGLAALQKWPALKEVWIFEARISAAGLAKFRAARPEVRIDVYPPPK